MPQRVTRLSSTFLPGRLRDGLNAAGQPHLVATQWAEDTRRYQEPGCGAAFEPYGQVELDRHLAYFPGGARLPPRFNRYGHASNLARTPQRSRWCRRPMEPSDPGNGTSCARRGHDTGTTLGVGPEHESARRVIAFEIGRSGQRLISRYRPSTLRPQPPSPVLAARGRRTSVRTFQPAQHRSHRGKGPAPHGSQRPLFVFARRSSRTIGNREEIFTGYLFRRLLAYAPRGRSVSITYRHSEHSRMRETLTSRAQRIRHGHRWTSRDPTKSLRVGVRRIQRLPPSERHGRSGRSPPKRSWVARGQRRDFRPQTTPPAAPGPILETFRPSSIVAILAALITPSSRMTISGLLPAGARGPLQPFGPNRSTRLHRRPDDIAFVEPSAYVSASSMVLRGHPIHAQETELRSKSIFNSFEAPSRKQL